MDILKTSTDWAKAEIFSTAFFIVMGIVFVAISIGFWQMGKTELAKAYIIPSLVAGLLLLTIGIGLFSTNIYRVSSFTKEYNKDANAFIQSEIERVDKTLDEYKTIVFKAIPIIILIVALMIIFLSAPVWRAISITTLAMLTVILLIDGTAHARITNYKAQLISAEKELMK